MACQKDRASKDPVASDANQAGTHKADCEALGGRQEGNAPGRGEIVDGVRRTALYVRNPNRRTLASAPWDQPARRDV